MSLKCCNTANYMNLTQLKNGKSAEILEVNGKREIITKLKSMGVFPGTIITKKSAILKKGPVILTKKDIQFAIGYKTAEKIIVKPVVKGKEGR